MREIKFRAWDGKRMILLSDLSIGLKKGTKKICPYAYFAVDTFGGHVSLAKHELMQFTGLLDKNGKEIYESDILRSFHFMDRNKPQYLYHKVVYDDKYYSFNVVNLKNTDELLTTNGNTFLYVLAKNNEFEIIGNIYENPDLL